MPEQSRLREVERLARGDPDSVWNRIAATRTPFVFTDAAATDEWRASECWTPEVLKERTGQALVTVNRQGEGRPPGNFGPDTRGRFHVVQRPLAEYIDEMASAHPPTSYAAQIPIGRLHRSLAAEVSVPRALAIAPIGSIRTHLWIGSGGAVIPLHYDFEDNLHTMLFGKKRFVLFDVADSRALYPHLPLSRVPDWSRVDIDAPDERRFPRFSRGLGFETTMGPGETLFVPAGWWHHVRILEAAVSVNFWWMHAAYRRTWSYLRLLPLFVRKRVRGVVLLSRRNRLHPAGGSL